MAVSGSTVWVGRSKLQAVDAGTGAKKGSFATSTVATDPSLRGHNTPPQHREFLLLGGWLYSACQCDSLTQGGTTRGVKALVRFNPTTGAHDPGFTPAGAGVTATGISVATDGTNLYLGAGGSDLRRSVLAQRRSGVEERDTSGSAQAVRVSGGDVLVGGHFVEIADAAGDGLRIQVQRTPAHWIRTTSARRGTGSRRTRSAAGCCGVEPVGDRQLQRRVGGSRSTGRRSTSVVSSAASTASARPTTRDSTESRRADAVRSARRCECAL